MAGLVGCSAPFQASSTRPCFGCNRVLPTRTHRLHPTIGVMAPPFPGHSDAQVRAVLDWLSKDATVAQAIHEGLAIVTSSNNIEALDGKQLPFAFAKETCSPIGQRKRKAATTSSEMNKSLKRASPEASKAQPLPICVNCSEEFDWHKNHKRACRSHSGRSFFSFDVSNYNKMAKNKSLLMSRPGTLSVDHSNDYWRDCEWDDELDTPENRLEHPQGFSWSCCYKDGTNVGCLRRAHRRSKTLPTPKGFEQPGEQARSSSPSEVSVRDTDSETDEEDYEDFYTKE